MTDIPELSASTYFTPPAGVNGKARFDADNFVRAVDAMIQGWISGKLALAEGSLLQDAFDGVADWLPYVTQLALVGVLQWVLADLLPRLTGGVNAIAAGYPEVQKPAESAVTRLEEILNAARVALKRYTRDVPVNPLHILLKEYRENYTSLGIAKAAAVADKIALDGAQQRLGVCYDAVNTANKALVSGFDTISNANQKFLAGLAETPVAKVTPAQRRTLREYAAILQVLKNAWSVSVSAVPATIPKSRGKETLGRVVAAFRRGNK